MSDVLYNLLYSMRIYADVQVLQGTAFPRIYESMDEGISELQRALGLSTQEHDDTIGYYLERRGRREGERVMLEDDTVYVKISWRTDRQTSLDFAQPIENDVFAPFQ